jgi:hypothetical protein
MSEFCTVNDFQAVSEQEFDKIEFFELEKLH